jgi:ATP-dependent RNA helicase DeaD
MDSFQQMGLPPTLVASIEKMNITVPTPIQAQTIPLALTNKDILGSAQTGTGKTLAFAIPLVCHLLNFPESAALVLVPTRELAEQVLTTIKKLIISYPAIRMALLIGGTPYFKQMQQLRARPRIIVGTPGRIIDHMQRNTVDFSQTGFLALDEADRMFDMGFGIQIEEIIKNLPRSRQTVMFSATMPQNIERLAAKYLNSPERISVGSSTQPLEKIKQEMIKVSEADKLDQLFDQLQKREGSIIIFVKTKYGADDLTQLLIRQDYSAVAIHGDLRQRQRDFAIQDFRKGRYTIMVATDIAARGLDIPHIEHVINYDLPQCAEDYIHRIGRTGRAGKEGSALCMVTPQDRRKWDAIQKLLDPTYKSPYTGGGFNDRNRSPRRNGGGGSWFSKSGDQRREGGGRPSFRDRDRDRDGGGAGGGGRGGRSGGGAGGGGGNPRRSSNSGEGRRTRESFY